MSLTKTINTIKQCNSFLISTHVHPDPDAICSELAMALFLRANKKKVTIINQDDVPCRFDFFPGVHMIKSLRQAKRASYDTMIILDCGNLDRIGQVKTLIDPGQTIINIDHHITNDDFGHVNAVYPKASSTAEVLFELMKQAKFKLTKDVAMNLYLGIMTDTGSFRYECTTARTHAVTAELRKFNFSAHSLYGKIYETVPLKDLKAFTKVLLTFDFLCGGRVICMELSKRVLSKFSEDFDLRDMIFKFLRSIKGVEVVAIFTEANKRETRVNFRSSDYVDVAKLANQFGGGGHQRASGCAVEKDLKGARRAVLSRVRMVI